MVLCFFGKRQRGQHRTWSLWERTIPHLGMKDADWQHTWQINAVLNASLKERLCQKLHLRLLGKRNQRQQDVIDFVPLNI